MAGQICTMRDMIFNGVCEDILDEAFFIEANLRDKHLHKTRTCISPEVWKKLYPNNKYPKSQWSQVFEQCRRTSIRMVVDKDTVERSPNVAKFLEVEMDAYYAALRNKVIKKLFYGDASKFVDDFNGLSLRYPADSCYVVDAGGSGNVTSIWLISWSDVHMYFIFPQQSEQGFEAGRLHEARVSRDGGPIFDAYSQDYHLDLGLVVRDPRSCVRIINVPVDRLHICKGKHNFLDLQQLVIQAKNKMPEVMRQKAYWYCNQEVMDAFELQSTESGNIHMVYSAEQFYAGHPCHRKVQPLIFGRPIKLCAQLSNSEEF